MKRILTIGVLGGASLTTDMAVHTATIAMAPAT